MGSAVSLQKLSPSDIARELVLEDESLRPLGESIVTCHVSGAILAAFQSSHEIFQFLDAKGVINEHPQLRTKLNSALTHLLEFQRPLSPDTFTILIDRGGTSTTIDEKRNNNFIVDSSLKLPAEHIIKPLAQLSSEEVLALLRSDSGLSRFQDIFVQRIIDGEMLARVRKIEDLMRLGIQIPVVWLRVLFKHIVSDWQKNGVSLDLIQQLEETKSLEKDVDDVERVVRNLAKAATSALSLSVDLNSGEAVAAIGAAEQVLDNLVRVLSFEETAWEILGGRRCIAVAGSIASLLRQNRVSASASLCERALKVLKLLTREEEVHEDSERAGGIRSDAKDGDVIETCGRLGLCALVVQVMKKHSYVPNIQLEALAVIANLALNNSSNSKLLAAAGACETVVQVLQAAAKEMSILIVIQGCLAINSLGGSDNPETKEALGADGACAALACVLRLHGTTDCEVAREVCHALHNVTVNSTENQRLFAAESKAHETLVELLRVPCSDEVVEQVSRALSSISNNDESRRLLVQAECCEAVTKLLSDHGEEASSLLVKHVALALGNFASESAYRERLVNLGAIESLIRLLSGNRNIDPETCAQVCLAVYKLASPSAPETIVRLKSVGIAACEVIVEALTLYGTLDQQLSFWALNSISDLAYDNEEYQSRMVEVGACEAICRSLLKFGRFDSGLAEQGCGAIYALLVSSSPQRGYTSTRSTGAGAGASSKGAMKRFGESGACEAVAMVMTAHGELCTKTSKMACRAVARLAVNCENRTKLGRADICASLMKAYRANGRKSADFSEQACLAISSVSYKDGNCKYWLGAAGACEAVVDTLARHGLKGHNMNIIEQACIAVAHLAVDATNGARIREAGGCDAVLRVLKMGLKFLESTASQTGFDENKSLQAQRVVEMACWAICSLCYSSWANKTKLTAIGAHDALNRVIDCVHSSASGRSKAAEALSKLSEKTNNL